MLGFKCQKVEMKRSVSRNSSGEKAKRSSFVITFSYVDQSPSFLANLIFKLMMADRTA